ncbi:hypothetical protein HN51_051879, partial [Arachis hypogaea]
TREHLGKVCCQEGKGVEKRILGPSPKLDFCAFQDPTLDKVTPTNLMLTL